MAYVSEELTHFVGRKLQTEAKQFQLLLTILRTGWLQASYSVEFGPGIVLMADGSKPLTSNEAVRATTVCFCDIPFDDLKIHMAKYSRFGLAFAKRFMLSRGASPVFYVAQNAAPPERPGIGPKTLGDQFNLLRREVTELCNHMQTYADSLNQGGKIGDTGERLTFKHAPPGTPEVLRILGKLNALASDLDGMVFAHLRFFDGGLSEDHGDNLYMEREWRKVGGLAFALKDVSRVILPMGFASRFRTDLPGYRGQICEISDD